MFVKLLRLALLPSKSSDERRQWDRAASLVALTWQCSHGFLIVSDGVADRANCPIYIEVNTTKYIMIFIDNL